MTSARLETNWAVPTTATITNPKWHPETGSRCEALSPGFTACFGDAQLDPDYRERVAGVTRSFTQAVDEPSSDQ